MSVCVCVFNRACVDCVYICRCVLQMNLRDETST